MKYFPMLCLVLLALASSGCSSDPEDRTFFGKGWWNPEKGANQRIANPATLSRPLDDYAKTPQQQPQQPSAYPMEQKPPTWMKAD